MSTSTLRGLALASVATLSALAATVGVAGSAGAADSADTTTTFTLTGGGLSIDAPGSKNLGSVATGTMTIQGELGSITVVDNRGRLNATWTANASATDFKTGGGTAAETIPANTVFYDPGLVADSASPVTGAFVGTPKTLGTSLLPVFTGTTVGNNTATWTPEITINVPAQAVVGTYTGTITHSVS